jgi:mono/diheme cytochrome c family protein
MSMRERLPCAAVAAFVTGLGTAIAAQGQSFGQPIAPGDAAAWDISIAPDGVGLPPGNGTPAQGAVVYAEKCAACHGQNGEGQPNDRLVGGQLRGDQPAVKTVGSYWPYATTLFDYTRRAMPWQQPKSLTNDEVYAVSAYILRLNGVIGDNDVMNATTLPKVAMPNRDGFVPLYPNKK